MGLSGKKTEIKMRLFGKYAVFERVPLGEFECKSGKVGRGRSTPLVKAVFAEFISAKTTA